MTKIMYLILAIGFLAAIFAVNYPDLVAQSEPVEDEFAHLRTFCFEKYDGHIYNLGGIYHRARARRAVQNLKVITEIDPDSVTVEEGYHIFDSTKIFIFPGEKAGALRGYWEAGNDKRDWSIAEFAEYLEYDFGCLRESVNDTTFIMSVEISSMEFFPPWESILQFTIASTDTLAIEVRMAVDRRYGQEPFKYLSSEVNRFDCGEVIPYTDASAEAKQLVDDALARCVEVFNQAEQDYYAELAEAARLDSLKEARQAFADSVKYAAKSNECLGIN